MAFSNELNIQVAQEGPADAELLQGSVSAHPAHFLPQPPIALDQVADGNTAALVDSVSLATAMSQGNQNTIMGPPAPRYTPEEHELQLVAPPVANTTEVCSNPVMGSRIGVTGEGATISPISVIPAGVQNRGSLSHAKVWNQVAVPAPPAQDQRGLECAEANSCAPSADLAVNAWGAQIAPNMGASPAADFGISLGLSDHQLAFVTKLANVVTQTEEATSRNREGVSLGGTVELTNSSNTFLCQQLDVSLNAMSSVPGQNESHPCMLPSSTKEVSDSQSSAAPVGTHATVPCGHGQGFEDFEWAKDRPVPAGGRKQEKLGPQVVGADNRATVEQVSARVGTRGAKAPAKRKPRTYSQATPSQHCHICSRRPTEQTPHVPCGNLAKGKCRKTICQKCFSQYGWSIGEAMNSSITGWVCSHCAGVCPERAQCHIYDRTSERRRNNAVNHRKPKLKAEKQTKEKGSVFRVGNKVTATRPGSAVLPGAKRRSAALEPGPRPGAAGAPAIGIGSIAMGSAAVSAFEARTAASGPAASGNFEEIPAKSAPAPTARSEIRRGLGKRGTAAQVLELPKSTKRPKTTCTTANEECSQEVVGGNVAPSPDLIHVLSKILPVQTSDSELFQGTEVMKSTSDAHCHTEMSFMQRILDALNNTPVPDISLPQCTPVAPPDVLEQTPSQFVSACAAPFGSSNDTSTANDEFHVPQSYS